MTCVPAAFQQRSSMDLQKTVINHRRSSVPDVPALFRVGAYKHTKQSNNTHVFFARVYKSSGTSGTLERCCFYCVISFDRLERCWNAAGTQS